MSDKTFHTYSDEGSPKSLGEMPTFEETPSFEEIDSELVRRADGTMGIKHPSNTRRSTLRRLSAKIKFRRADGTLGIKHPSWSTLKDLENTRRDMLRRVSTKSKV